MKNKNITRLTLFQRELDRASGGRIELEKVRSSEGKRVSRLWEQLRYSEPNHCQASTETLKVTGKESPSILPCNFEGIEQVKKLSSGMRFFAHAQNDVAIHEKQIFSYNLNENEDTPSTCGRGIEFQHEGRVLEIQGEGANNSLRFLLASLASSRATLHFDLTFSQLKTESLRQMTFGYARSSTPANTYKSFAQNDVKNASFLKEGVTLLTEGLKQHHSEERERRMKASAYPFNTNAWISTKESSLYNNPKAGLPRRCAPDVQTPTLTLPIGEGELKNVSKKKAAFTLAEVLITLGIIGVVAAMTLPALIQKHQKQVTVTGLRKFYSILAQAKQLSEAQNGEMTYWQFPNTQTHSDIEPFFDKYFRPYMSVINKCESINDCSSAIYNNTSGVTYTLKDGMQFYFAPNAQTSTLTGNYIYIIVDINGNKAPNKPGRDIFHLDIMPKRGAVMLGQMSELDNAYNLSREELKNGVSINEGRDIACCSDECASSTYKYHACGALIQADGWEIKDDYPW